MQVEKVVKDNGLTLLINNAGIAERAPTLCETTREAMQLHFNIHATSPLMIIKVGCVYINVQFISRHSTIY